MKSICLCNKKGVTLIELMVVVALIAVILLPISTFLINNYKVFNKGEKQIDSQRSAQYAMNLLIARAMEAKSMDLEKESSGNIRFAFNLEGSKKWMFYYNSDAGILFGNRSSSNTDPTQLQALAENISSLGAAKIGGNKGVQFTLESKYGGELVKITNEAVFRNR
jgi:prepilin-type N-terminal cleavage/methylation domain-containing protein